MVEEWDKITSLPTNTSESHLPVEQLLRNTFWTLAEDPSLPKGKRISSEWQRAKDKYIKRQRICGQGPTPWGGICDGGKASAHLQTPSWVGMGGALEPQRAMQRERLGRQNRENLPQRWLPRAVPAKKWHTHPLQQVGASCWESGFMLRLGLHVEAQASGVGLQRENQGWRP